MSASSIQVEFWHLITLFLGFIGVLATFGQIMLGQLDKRLEKQGQRMDNIERDLREMQLSLPNTYQRREDAIRFETMLNAKLDAIGGRMERLIEQRNT
jgi:uncharacterized damage-inducible protein DinB